MNKGDTINYLDKCKTCSGNRYLKTPLQEEYKCYECQGKGVVFTTGIFVKHDDFWDDYVLIEGKSGQKHWLFIQHVLEKTI